MPLGGVNIELVLPALNRLAPVIQSLVAKKVHLRRTPRLRFLLDDSFENAARMNKLLPQSAKSNGAMARKRGQPVHGWVNLDKPKGVSSAKAVALSGVSLMQQRQVTAARLTAGSVFADCAWRGDQTVPLPWVNRIL